MLFTGLIEDIGKIEKIVKKTGNAILSIRCDKISQEAKQGESISVNGICLTVKNIIKSSIEFDVSPETVARSTFEQWRRGINVNLEQALRPSSRIGGHFVLGHIDCISKIKEIKKKGSFYLITIDIPDGIDNYIVEKGSIAVDGISLTVASRKEKEFDVSLIPETFKRTTVNTYSRGTGVNIETDILAKYIEMITNRKKNDENSSRYTTLENLSYK